MPFAWALLRFAGRCVAFIVPIFLSFALVPARAAAPPMSELVQAQLSAEPSAIRAGETFWVGVRLRMKEHWHVYWRNPGDSGEATAIKWQLPPGFEAGPIVWPTPSRLPVAHLVNFGYEGETTLLTQIRAPATLDASRPIDIKADVSWLVCEKECIPGEASLALTLPATAAGASAPPDGQKGSTFDAARARVPQPSPWSARMDVQPERLTLTVAAGNLNRDTIRSAFYFPFAETLVRHGAPQQLDVTADGLVLRIERSALSVAAPADAGGVLVIEEALGTTTARQAFELRNVALGVAPPETASLAAVLQAAVLALLGGVILNLMPCVFPVLSIKVLGLMEQAGQSRAHVRRHGFAYTAGVLAAFTVLALTLLGVRAAGAEVGWGFQLQSPVTVAILVYVLFAMGLSLSGVFYVGSGLQDVGHGLAARSGLPGSFFAGLLAAVVATPCTAPFMATAIGFAVTQPAVIALGVFLALGLGLSLPFLLLTLAPQLITRLPRPGAWMVTLKQFLAFPVYATVAWLVWVLAQQVGPAGLFAALIGLVLIALAAWSFNVTRTASGWGRGLAAGTVAASLLGTIAAFGGLLQDQGRVPALQAASAAGTERFTQARLDELRSGNRFVFVNMTAAWCITCLVNEQAALSTGTVKAAFSARNIAYLKGDWTTRNPEITRVLEKHGRSGVPLYLLYAGAGEPVVLPQILTPAIVLEHIDRMGEPLQRRASVSTTHKE
jgi:thiol:disulfide interchange protein